MAGHSLSSGITLRAAICSGDAPTEPRRGEFSGTSPLSLTCLTVLSTDLSLKKFN